MRSKSGMTLVEIIVAIAILGIIGVGLMPALLSNFVFLEKTKEITNDTFLAQQSMELAIEAMKDDIVAGKLGQESYSEVSFSDEVTVKYQLVENTFNNVSYTTLVSQTRVPEEEKLNHLSVSATLYDNTYKVFNAYPLSDNNITGKVVNITSPSWMADINEWYVSDLGYNIPVPQGNTFGDESYDYLEHIDEIDIGNKYPIFPDDYSLIVGANNLKINDMSSYAGRHIIFKSTPASKTGKIGNPMWSNPVYISALTDVTNLLVHLDGAYIDPSNSDVTNISAGKVNLKKWYDLSSIIGIGASGPYPNESASYQGNQPIVNDNPIDASFMGRYVKFDSSSAIRLNAQGTRNKQLFIYAVVRGEPGAQILRFENGNSLSIPADTDPELEEIGNSGEGTENWKIVKTSLKVSNTSNTNNNIIIGNSDIEIAEILIYQSSEISDGVVEYLDNKYKPYNRIYEIDHLYDMEVEVDAGDTYIPPLAVKGKMAYGGDRYVSVKWSNNGAAIDTTNTTSGVIERTITGASIVSEINPIAKQMTLKVKIYPRVSSVTVTPETLELSPDDGPYPLVVTVLPNAARNKRVIWSSQNASVAEVDDSGVVTAKAAGTTTITATSEDNGMTDSVSVTVTTHTFFPEGLVLDLDANLGVQLTSSYVSRWADQSGNNNDFVQTIYDYRPGYSSQAINNFPGITFNPYYTEHLLYQGSNISDVSMFTRSSTPFTLFIVGSSDKKSNSKSTFFSQYVSNNNTSFGVLRSNNGKFMVSNYGSNRIQTNGDSEVDLHTTLYNGMSLTYRLNQSTVETDNSFTSTNNNGSYFYIGKMGGNNSESLDGSIGEIMLFNRALTTEEVAQVETYLYDKWFRVRTLSYEFDTNDHISGHDINGSSLLNWISPSQVGGNITGIDPYFSFPTLSSGANINLDTSKTIKIRLKNATSASTAQLYFTTYETGESNMDESKVINFPINPNSDYTEYTVDMSAVTKWRGRLRQLRFDPAVYSGGYTGPYGSFELDYIRIIQ